MIAPIGVGEDGETYNVNADMAAGAIAAAVQAKRLLLLTDVAGVLDSSGKLIEELSIGEVPRLIERGVITGGMIPKVRSCVDVVEAGVEGVVIVDGRVPHCVLIELLTPAWRRHADISASSERRQRRRQELMKKRGFAEVETWIFDLDNTLYPASCRLFDQIDVRMGTFIAELLGVDRAAAKAVQKDFFYRYGTTLRGLMLEHGVAPDAFLDYVHDIDHSPIPADGPLAGALETLPGRKLIFTNGTVAHAEKVLERLGVGGHFTDIFDIVHSDFIPKPQLEPYEKFVAVHAIEPQRAAMFEDIARNLEIPHRLGMTTVLVTCPDNADGNLLNAQGGSTALDHVDHVTDDLSVFLTRLVGTLGSLQGGQR